MNTNANELNIVTGIATPKGAATSILFETVPPLEGSLRFMQ